MGGQQITVTLCLALLVICSAAPSLTRRDNEELSLSNETPEKLVEDVTKNQKAGEYNEDEQNGRVQGLADTSSAIASGFTQSNSQQLQQLKEFLSLEVNNKDKFAQIYSQMSPEQVKKIREQVLRVGQQTGSQELIKLGQCKSPRFNQKQVGTLMALGESLYERLNTDTGLQVNRALGDGSNDNAMFNQLKTSISSQQDFIRRLVNMIEVQLSKAPQIDEVEFANIKQITEQIKSLSAQVQTQLSEATDLSQLTKMGDELLQINNLSSQLQQKVSAELLEERMKEYLGSISDVNNQQQATENTGTSNQVTDTSDSVNIQTRDTSDTDRQTSNDMEKLLGGVQWFFQKLRNDAQTQQLLAANRPYISQYASQAIRQAQQYPHIANAFQFAQQQYPQLGNVISNIQQEYPQVGQAIQSLQQIPQESDVVTTHQETQNPDLLTTQNADGSLTLQAADSKKETNTVESNLTSGQNTMENQQNLETVDNETSEATNVGETAAAAPNVETTNNVETSST